MDFRRPGKLDICTQMFCFCLCVCSVQHRIIGVGEEGVDEVSKRKAEDMFPGSDRW